MADSSKTFIIFNLLNFSYVQLLRPGWMTSHKLYVLFFFISVGDCIVAVNDSSTVNVTHQQAVEALKAAGGVVTLVIMLICDLICQILFEANQTNTVHIYSAALCCQWFSKTKYEPAILVCKETTGNGHFSNS